MNPAGENSFQRYSETYLRSTSVVSTGTYPAQRKKFPNQLGLIPNIAVEQAPDFAQLRAARFNGPERDVVTPEVVSVLRSTRIRTDKFHFLMGEGMDNLIVRRAFGAISNGVTICDATLPGAPLLYVNPAFERMTGYSVEEVGGLNCNFLQGTDRDQPGVHRIRAAIREAREERVLLRNYRKDGTLFWNELSLSPIFNAAGTLTHFVGIQNDVTEQKLAELQLVYQANHDEMTGLPNRRLFREMLQQALTECRSGDSGAVFFVDLDGLKLVNDTFGHLAGDQILKAAAQRMQAACGKTASLARFGGDEFALFGTGLETPEMVRRVGENLIHCLEEPFSIADRDVFLGASVGISRFPQDGTDSFVLKGAADVAMHQAKRAGKNQLRFFIFEFAERAREELEMEGRLRKALALSEFKLQFQPLFAEGRSLPSRFEALVRWHPPGAKPVPPLQFVPFSEKNGLIVPIGAWVLRTACQRCAEWQNTNLRGIGVAVNVSALQVAHPDFVEFVSHTLKSTRLSPRLLEIEVTESVFIEDVTASSRVLKMLRNLGVTIALDDFGTGFSSLSYLQNLPLDALKVDRSFLPQDTNIAQGAAILRCVTELAHAIGLRVVAEGIETPAQVNLLAGMGCDEMQGFFLGRPSFDLAEARDGCAADQNVPQG